MLIFNVMLTHKMRNKREIAKIQEIIMLNLHAMKWIYEWMKLHFRERHHTDAQFVK